MPLIEGEQPATPVHVVLNVIAALRALPTRQREALALKF